MEHARLFALAVKTSTTAFIQLARNHDQYVKHETAAMLNDRGFARTFVLGALVKARFPPTKAELDLTGRRSSHVSSWRGPCKVIDRLSSTTYRIKQLDNLRLYERSISNLLPWRATTARTARHARFDAAISTPLLVGKFLAVRDQPNSWFYIAKVTYVGLAEIIVHYYGTKSDNLQRAKFHPCWHRQVSEFIQLSPTKPHGMMKYSGVLDFNALLTLLVARDIKLTTISTLTSKSRRLLMPIRDELFIYE